MASALNRNIERKWIAHFRKCPLVNRESGKLDADLAKQLFAGKTEERYQASWPHHYTAFYQNRMRLPAEEVTATFLQFMSFVGIRLTEGRVQKHVQTFPDDLEKLLRRGGAILRTLENFGELLNIENPFRENWAEIDFLARVESGESISGGQLSIFEDVELPDMFRRISQLPDGYENDPVVTQLFERIEHADSSFFITGKAGTGKSTFIHYFTSKTKKKVVLTAFTGVAAVNVGGQTIHSFFRLPFQPLLPGDEEIPTFSEHAENRKIIQEMDVLIIDEVSMLRSDILEAIDCSLRKNGGDAHRPFGGKQVLLIGDIFQLPPVYNESNEAELYVFSEIYKSPYFFDAPAFVDLRPAYFEFSKSHRQREDLAFVELLDKVRTCKVDDATLAQLNTRFTPNLPETKPSFVIHLTATNHVAEEENTKRLEDLPGSDFVFEAIVTGEFKPDRYPAPHVLRLRKHAQVIFLKNDSGANRWVNGTIARIDFISPNLIEVRLQNGDVHQVERTTWENRRYKFDKVKRKIVSELLGTYTQFPLKLAWAITIHKSQGLTFDNVVIDLGRGAFVNGQLYTALSRCRTLDGILLNRKIRHEDVIADARVIQFYETCQ